MSNIGKNPTLTIGANTRMQDADAFLSKAATDGKKVYGKRDADTGAITLYMKSGTSNRLAVRDHIFSIGGFKADSHHAVKQQTAREGLAEIFRNHEAANNGRGLSDKSQAANTKLFENLRTAIAGEGSLSVGDAKTLFSTGRATIETFEKSLGAAPAPAPQAPARGGAPTLASLAGGAIPASLTLAAGSLKTDTKVDSAALAVGKAVCDAVLRTIPDKSERFLAMMSDTAALKGELVAALKAELAQGGGKPVSDQQISAFADAALKSAREATFGIEVGTTSVKLPAQPGGQPTDASAIPLFSISSGGKEFKPTSCVAVGGFATIYRLQADDGTKRIMKVPTMASGDPADMAAKLQGTKDEVAAHLAAEGAGHPNILKMHGLAQMPNGQFGIILDDMPNGDVEGFLGNVYQQGKIAPDGTQPASGQITQAEMNLISLALLSDMAKGTDHLHNSQGTINFDAKPANMLIGADGIGRISDFGTTKMGSSLAYTEAPEIIEVAFKAPEFTRVTEGIDLCFKTTKGQLNKLFGGANDELLDNLVEATIEHLGQTTLTQAVDTWGLGASLMQMATGHKANDDTQFGFERAEKLATFAGSGTRALAPADAQTGGVAEGALFVESGDPQINALANKLLAPKPEDRPSMADVLKDPALNRPGAKSPELRALIVALKSGDNAKVDQARADLTEAIRKETTLRQNPTQLFQGAPTIRTSVGPGGLDGPGNDDAPETGIGPGGQRPARTITQEFAEIGEILARMNDELLGNQKV